MNTVPKPTLSDRRTMMAACAAKAVRIRIAFSSGSPDEDEMVAQAGVEAQIAALA